MAGIQECSRQESTGPSTEPYGKILFGSEQWGIAALVLDGICNSSNLKGEYVCLAYARNLLDGLRSENFRYRRDLDHVLNLRLLPPAQIYAVWLFDCLSFSDLQWREEVGNLEIIQRATISLLEALDNDCCQNPIDFLDYFEIFAEITKSLKHQFLKWETSGPISIMSANYEMFAESQIQYHECVGMLRMGAHMLLEVCDRFIEDK